MKQLAEEEIQAVLEDRNNLIARVHSLEFQLQQEKNLNRDNEKDYLAIWNLIKLPDESVVEAVYRILKERDDLLKCLESWRCDGNGCFCDAQFAMYGANPRHSEECEQSMKAIKNVKNRN